MAEPRHDQYLTHFVPPTGSDRFVNHLAPLCPARLRSDGRGVANSPVTFPPHSVHKATFGLNVLSAKMPDIEMQA